MDRHSLAQQEMEAASSSSPAAAAKADQRSLGAKALDFFYEGGGRVIGNIRQELDRFFWGHVSSHTMGERAPSSPSQGDPLGRSSPAEVPSPASPGTIQPRDFWAGAEEREATADAWSKMQAAGTENALAETREAVGHHPYSFHDAPDRESRSDAQEAMEARTAGLQAQERADNMAAANLYSGPQPQGLEHPGSDIER